MNKKAPKKHTKNKQKSIPEKCRQGQSLKSKKQRNWSKSGLLMQVKHLRSVIFSKLARNILIDLD